MEFPACDNKQLFIEENMVADSRGSLVISTIYYE